MAGQAVNKPGTHEGEQGWTFMDYLAKCPQSDGTCAVARFTDKGSGCDL